MKIICVYPLNPDMGYKAHNIVPFGAFIEPFYAGDILHHLVLNTNRDFRYSLEGHTDLRLKYNRKDLAPLFFNSREEAEQYAEKEAFGMQE